MADLPDPTFNHPCSNWTMESGSHVQSPYPRRFFRLSPWHQIPEHRRNDGFKCFMYLSNLDTNRISKMQGMRQCTKFCFRREANNKALCRIVASERSSNVSKDIQFCRAYLLKIEPSYRTNSGQADTACGADQSVLP